MRVRIYIGVIITCNLLRAHAMAGTFILRKVE